MKIIVFALIMIITIFLSQQLFAFERMPEDNSKITKEQAIEIARGFIIEKGHDKKCDVSKPKIVVLKDSFENVWSVYFPVTDKQIRRNSMRWFVVRVDKNSGEIFSYGLISDL